MAALTHHESIEIARSPEEVWDLVSDVTRTGEWSPICRGAEWADGASGPVVGAYFVGHNETPTRQWSTRSQVVAAERGRIFAWEVNGGWVYWAYTMEPSAAGTTLTEWWEFRDAGLAGFRERYGERSDAEIEVRRAAALEGIPATLAAIRRIAEG